MRAKRRQYPLALILPAICAQACGGRKLVQRAHHFSPCGRLR
jgi:hypothetical protein